MAVDGTTVGTGTAARAVGTRLAGAAAAALLAHYLPSTAVLGQWTPARRAPGNACRWRGPRHRPKVALTFDDGPHPEGTPAVLDRLDALGLRATFFTLGAAAVRHPELVAEIARRGHQVATHGYHHDHHLLRSPRWVRRDLSRAEEAMAAAGQRVRWYRPSYGQATLATFATARRLGWEPVLWSHWGREWKTPDPVAVAGRAVRRLGPGSIVLLHDSDEFGRQGMWRTVDEALPLVAAELDRRGLVTATLDDLVR